MRGIFVCPCYLKDTTTMSSPQRSKVPAVSVFWLQVCFFNVLCSDNALLEINKHIPNIQTPHQGPHQKCFVRKYQS